jgi:DNA polymerase III subunit epsilon
MTRWFEGPLAAFGITATGADAEQDRIVSATLVVQDLAGARPGVTRWLVDPGVLVPPGAAEAQGLTDDFLHHNGRWPAPVVEELAGALAAQCAAGRPLVVMDAPFGLTLLDRELRRHRSSSLGDRLADIPLCVLDPRVLDGHLDRYRKGSRELTDLCARYEVPRDGPPDTSGGELATRTALELARAIGRRFAIRLERLSPAELHTLQTGWYPARTRGPRAWFSRPTGAAAPAWPFRPKLPATDRPRPVGPVDPSHAKAGPSTTDRPFPVGDTGFEPVTSSV